MEPLETKLENMATEYALKHGMLVLKLNVKGRIGWPDRIFAFDGRVMFIEFKRKGESLRPAQEYVHSQLRKHKLTVYVVDTIEQAYEVINGFARG